MRIFGSFVEKSVPDAVGMGYFLLRLTPLLCKRMFTLEKSETFDTYMEFNLRGYFKPTANYIRIYYSFSALQI